MSSQSFNSAMSDPLSQVPKPKGVYPLNGEDNPMTTSTSGLNATNSNSKAYILPDFKVWNHTPKDDNIMRAYVQKGYYEVPVVSNESLSGRQLVSHLLTKPSNNGNNNTVPIVNTAKLQNLSDVMVSAINRRRENNKIKLKSTYKPPPRVTVTDHKREIWMRNLADFNSPLRQLARAIPHGLRNKVLLEQLTFYKVPISRALWLIRCVSTNEQRQLKRKVTGSNAGNSNVNQNQANNAFKVWTIEWTDQICMFLESTIDSCFNKQTNANWREKLDYIVELVGNLYIEELLSRETMLSWVIRYFGDLAKNEKLLNINDFKNISIHLVFIKLFWFKIIQIDYFSKELGEYMLIVTKRLYELKTTKTALNLPLINSLYKQFQFLIRYLFYYNVDSFIIPNNWSRLKGQLKLTIDNSNPLVLEQFKLISYRNDSLMIYEINGNKGTDPSNQAISYYNKPSTIIYKLDNLIKNPDLKTLSKYIFDDMNDYDNDMNHVNINDLWRRNLLLILKWSITNYRDLKDENNKFNIGTTSRIYLVCSILKIKISSLKNKKNKQFRLEIERQILDFIYLISDKLFNKSETNSVNSSSLNNSIDLKDFLVLINELHTLNLFQTSSYLRRLIASGVIYLQDAKQSCYIHMLILCSLPNLSDSNSKNILKRLMNTISGQQLDSSSRDTLLQESKDRLYEFVINSCTKLNDDDVLFYDIDEFFMGTYNPLEIGKIYEIADWLLELIESIFHKNEKLYLNNEYPVIFLYKLFHEKLNKLPQFLYAVIRNIDQTPDHKFVVKETVMKLIFNLISINDELLSSTIIDSNKGELNSVYSEIMLTLKRWKKNDRFHMCNKLLNQVQFRKEFLVAASAPSSEDEANADDNANLGDTSMILDDDENNNAGTRGDDGENIIPLTNQELNQLGLKSMSRLTNAAEYLHHLNQAITHYYNSLKGFQTGNDLHTQLVCKFLKNLRLIKRNEFEKVLLNYLREIILPTLSFDYNNNLKLVLKLIIQELTTLPKIVQVLRSTSVINNNSFDVNSSEKMLNDIMFNLEDYYDLIGFDDVDKMSITIHKKNYMNNYYEEYFNIFKTCLKKNFLSSKYPTQQNNSQAAQVHQQPVHAHHHHESNGASLLGMSSERTPQNAVPSVDIGDDVINDKGDLVNPTENDPISVVQVDAASIVGGLDSVVNDGMGANSAESMSNEKLSSSSASSIVPEGGVKQSGSGLINMAIPESIEATNDDIVFDDIQMSSTTTNYGKFMKNMINCFWDILKTHSKESLELINEIQSCNNSKNFFISMLLLDNGNIGTVDCSIHDIVKNLNYFSLPILQILFKLIMEELFSHDNQMNNQYQMNMNLNKYIMELIKEVTIRFKNKDDDKLDLTYLFGNLFDLINNDLKVAIINCCEGIFFNSDRFPTLVMGDFNITFLITSIISNCSRLREPESNVDKAGGKLSDVNGRGVNDKSTNSSRNATPVITLTDSLVFSLNSALEKFNYYCTTMEAKLRKNFSSKSKRNEIRRVLRDFENSIILLSRILLIHKKFLVDLILQRSVNLQTDSFLINLTKLFNNKFMDSNFRLKNLLYDIIISMKLLISESLVLRGNISSPTTNSFNLIGTPTNLSISSLNVNKGASTPGNIMSPMNSPMFTGPSITMAPTGNITFGNPGSNLNINATSGSTNTNANSGGTASSSSNISNIMNISPPNYNNNLRHLLHDYNKIFKDGLEIQEREGGSSGEFDKNKESFCYYDAKSGYLVKYVNKKFEMIEESSIDMNNTHYNYNDSCISLQLFDSCVEKVNPK